MNLKPLHDRVIVKRLEETEQKIGGIIVPDTAREKPQRGRIVAVGDGRLRKDGGRVTPDVKTGDLVLFGKYSGQEIKVEGEELLIMKEDEVLAVLGGSSGSANAGGFSGKPGASRPGAGRSAGKKSSARTKSFERGRRSGAQRKPAKAAPSPRRKGRSKSRQRS
jgi:chaperonin GroES